MKELKQKKCKSCGVTFKPFSSLARVCSMACSLDYVDSQKAVKAKKAHVAQKRDFLANDKTFQRAKCQKAFNEFIRLRDAHLGCISCDKPADWFGQWAAGHYKTVGARSDLRFNEDNVHKQCNRDCNKGKSGNVGMYRIRLIQKIGIERVEALDADIEPPKKYNAEDYAAITETYQQKIKALKNERALQ
jgi:hypothetical protein